MSSPTRRRQSPRKRPADDKESSVLERAMSQKQARLEGTTENVVGEFVGNAYDVFSIC